MNVLLLRVAGPMQSWGVQGRFTVRDTGLEPSKSGVVGLLCAALGRRREESVDDLAELRMGVRVDEEGVILSDFHTAGKGGILKASGHVERENVVVSNRYYLAGARFLVGLEGEDARWLAGIHDALRDPVWPLYLGRKAFVPGEPVWLHDGLNLDARLSEVFAVYPWLGRDLRRRPQEVRWVMEAPDGAEVRPDWPLSFAQRRFAPRRVRTQFAPAPPVREEEPPCTSPG